VQFVERQPLHAMPEMMAAADALLVHLRRSDISQWVIPTKTLAYLAAGRPIIMATEGAAADLIAEAGAGTLVPSSDPAALASELRRLVSAPAEELRGYGERGRAHLEKSFSKTRVAAEYIAALEKVAGTA
jgi:glycosyltransferase involved in cell wall biosynthesis